MSGFIYEKNKLPVLAVLVLSNIFIFFPLISKSYDTPTVDITVSATISSSSTTPSPYCGDGSCNNGETCSSCSQDCGECGNNGGGGGGGGGGETTISPDTKVIFKGRAYPLANLTILKDGAVMASFKASASGLFEREITGIASGNYNFSIFAEDTEKRKSVTIGFSVGILENRITTISGIFISPTIDLGPTQVEKGQSITIAGQAFPESSINIFIASKEIIKETNATRQGKWSYSLDTGILEESTHEAKAQSLYGEGEQSSFSQTLSFLVVKKGALVCKGADLNFDNKVNLTDFSILLFYWGQKKPVNTCADINHDGIVNLVDFSIMMYYWTK
jgi:hypothetical protein